jgi:hypothetical protein
MTENILQKRGIEKAALDLQWIAAPNPYEPEDKQNKTPGWSYPVFEEDGSVIKGLLRWKASDSSNISVSSADRKKQTRSPKYVWYPPKDKRTPAQALPVYYTPKGLKEAIAKANGLLHFVSGEPDMLTLREFGWKNVTCAFGEKNIEKLAESLQAFGVKKIVYWRDRDQAGHEAAQLVRDELENSGIAFECRLLAGGNDDKYDLNKLWIDCTFDRAVFLETINASVVERLPTTPKNAPRRSKPRQNQAESDLYERWCLEVENAAVKAWGLSEANGQGFSKHITCPFHAEDTPSAHWNYQTHGLQCFGACGQHYSTDSVAEKLNHETFQAYKARVRMSAQRPTQQAPSKPKPSANGKQPVSQKRPDVVFVSSEQSAEKTKRIMQGKDMPNVQPFLCPYKPLHQFGGRLKMWYPRQSMLVIAASGWGKTSFVERITDNLCIEGMDSLLYGKEWTPRGYDFRRVARWGGPSIEKLEEHEAHMFEQAQGIQSGTRPLNADEFRKMNEILDMSIGWQGRVHYIDSAKSLSAALNAASNRVDEVRAEGRRFQLAVFDYAQKMLNSGSSWSELELAFGAIADFAAACDVFVIMISQVNKDAPEGVMKYGKLLDMQDAQMLSDQKANAVITLNPVFDKAGNRHEKAWIRCVKNSTSRGQGKILVKTAFWRHDWTDEVLQGIDYETTQNGTARNSEAPPPREYTDQDEPVSWVKE